jgi:hypothetical protein
MPEDELQLNGRNVPFVNNAKYLGVIFDRKMAWRICIETTAARPWAHTLGYTLYSKASI